MLREGLLTPADLNEPVNPKDPFPYGWRYVKKTGRNGADKMVQVPLTLEDILHPQEDDFRMLSDPHTADVHYLRAVLGHALKDDPKAVVLNDCRVAWDRDGDYGHGPDCAVIFKVRKKQRWSTFNVVKERTRPQLIIEVTSPSTRSTDLVNKVREYAAESVAHYVIADARETEEERRLTLIDYHLSPGSKVYYTLPNNDDGRVWLPEVNLWLGVLDGRLACFNTDGERQLSIAETFEKADNESRLRVEAERLCGEAERQAADEKHLRLEGERQAANERATLEKRLSELEERLSHASESKKKPGTNGK